MLERRAPGEPRRELKGERVTGGFFSATPQGFLTDFVGLHDIN